MMKSRWSRPREQETTPARHKRSGVTRSNKYPSLSERWKPNLFASPLSRCSMSRQPACAKYAHATMLLRAKHSLHPSFAFTLNWGQTWGAMFSSDDQLLEIMVGATGIEPVTPAMSTQCSPGSSPSAPRKKILFSRLIGAYERSLAPSSFAISACRCDAAVTRSRRCTLPQAIMGPGGRA